MLLAAFNTLSVSIWLQVCFFWLVRVVLAVLVRLLAVCMLLSAAVSVLAGCCDLLFSGVDGLFLLFFG
jgi:hypothetical protein